MDPYELLRRQAADKMDLAIKAARDTYRAEVAKINELLAALGHENPLGLRSRKRIGDMLRDHYPSDRTFTLDDVVVNAQAANPGQRFKRCSVRSAMQEHKEKGVIRRIGKEKNGATIWAVADLAVSEKPFGTMSYADVIADILVDSDGMRPAELAVAMQTLGFRREETPDMMVRQVSKSLYGNPRRFRRGPEGKWGLVTTVDTRAT